MRNLLFLIVFTFAAISLRSQNLKQAPYMLKPPQLVQKITGASADIIDTAGMKLIGGDRYIARLKQDNMPCIIPVLPQVNIPNAYKEDKFALGKIPNAWDINKYLRTKTK